MATVKEREAAEKAVSEIPVSGCGVMELYSTTLRSKLPRSMISEIVRVALDAAETARGS